jgi:GST-like protein
VAAVSVAGDAAAQGFRFRGFLPAKGAERAQALTWLMFVASGIGPYSGQAVHFRIAAPEPKAYALNRYDFEAHRHWKILDDRLAGQRWMVGNDYGIVDMAFWGWARLVPFVLGMDPAATWTQYPHMKRLLDDINARPAVARLH